MFGFLVAGFTSLFGITPVLVVITQAFISALITILYIIAIIQTLLSLRSGQSII